ncbi:hydantoinase/oxoprolinase family protein [Novosphingobium resinovorum]|uniref:hydantoinase/oxoprolinase family protein n=1 Tax=Novosphingobium resinovorum TaxID=158500 RepID=UPI002ED3CEFD
MRIGVDVGGTNTDAVLMDGDAVVAWTKQPTSADVSTGIAGAITAVLAQTGVPAGAVGCVMIGTTHFTNALVERRRLDEVGVLRLASPSGEALPPLTGWPEELARCMGDHVFLLPGGHEFDGREIAPFDADKVRAAVRTLRERGVAAIAISACFSPIDAGMEERAAAIVLEEHPQARVTLSSAIGRLGLIERENAAIVNAALGSLAVHVVTSFEAALERIGVAAPLFISQNDGTLISAAEARRHPVLTMGSGPTNSMRGAAFLTGVKDAVVIDVGGTTADIGVLANGIARECAIAVDIGGVRTNFRMPDILAIGLGGGTRVRLDPDLRVGPDSVGFRIAEEALLFGGETLTASDIAVAGGHASFGDPARLGGISPAVVAAVWQRMQEIVAEGIDRMKTARGKVTVLAVGGGNFLVGEGLEGVARVVRPPHAGVANAVGAAIAQVGAQVEHVVSYDAEPREVVLGRLREQARDKAIAAGGDADTVEIVEVDEVFLSYMPGRAAQVRVRAVAQLAAHRAPATRETSLAH